MFDRILQRISTRGKGRAALFVLATGVSWVALTTAFAQFGQKDEGKEDNRFDAQVDFNADRMIREGRRTFRFDTFGSESFWGDMLRLHQAIA